VISNHSQQPIQSIHLSPSSDNSWRDNRLNSALFSGDSAQYTLLGECHYDLKVVFANAQVLSQMEIDTCLNDRYFVSLRPQAWTLMPVTRAGRYRVYEKPAAISESQMQSAGARFYSREQACSLHHSLCTERSGVWLAQQAALSIAPEQTQPPNIVERTLTSEQTALAR